MRKFHQRRILQNKNVLKSEKKDPKNCSIDILFQNAEKLYQDTKNNFENPETKKEKKISTIEIQPKVERRIFQKRNMRSPDQRLLKPVLKMSQMKENLGQSHGPIGSNEKSSIFARLEPVPTPKRKETTAKRPSKNKPTRLKPDFEKIEKSVNKVMRRNKRKTRLGILANPMRDSLFKQRKKKNRSVTSKSPRLSKSSRKSMFNTPNPKTQSRKKTAQKNVNIYAQKIENNFPKPQITNQIRGYDSLKKNADSIFGQDKKFFETARRVESGSKAERPSANKGRRTVDFEKKPKNFAPRVNVKKILSDARTPFVKKETRSPVGNAKSKKRQLFFNKVMTSNKIFGESLRSPEPKKIGFSSLIRSKTRDWVSKSKFFPQKGVGSYQKMPKVSFKGKVGERDRKNFKNSKNMKFLQKQTR